MKEHERDARSPQIKRGPDDPILLRLLDEHERTAAALRTYICRATPAEPEDDLLTLKQAAFVFGKSEDTIRRWAVDEGLGVQPGGRNTLWLVSREAVMRVKRVLPTLRTQNA